MKFQATLSLQQSIQCVRWLRPTAQTYGHKTLYFIAGLSNDPQLALYECQSSGLQAFGRAPLDFTAKLKKTASHPDVLLDMTCIDETLLATLGHQQAYLYQIAKTQDEPDTIQRLAAIPITSSSSSLSSIAAPSLLFNTPEIAVSGEDGYLYMIRIDTVRKTEQSIPYSMPLTSVKWASTTQLFASTNAGQVLVYDRRDLRKPCMIISSESGTMSSFSALAAHPSQVNKFAVGDQEGHVVVWDIRRSMIPLKETLQAHYGPVCESLFHPIHNHRLLSCSEDGTVAFTFWDVKDQGSLIELTKPHQRIQSLEYTFNPLGINSMDYNVTGQSLICGTESGQLLFYFEHELSNMHDD